MRFYASLVLCFLFSLTLIAQTPALHKQEFSRGKTMYVQGNLGELGIGKKAGSEAAFVQQQVAPSRNKRAIETLDVTRTEWDDLGMKHTKVGQFINGMPVEGAEVVVHSDSAGSIFYMNGLLANTDRTALSPTITADEAVANVLEKHNIKAYEMVAKPELTYVADENGEAFLAYKMTLFYNDGEKMNEDAIFADATGQNRFVRWPQLCGALSRAIYLPDPNSNNYALARSEGDPTISGDAYANTVYNQLGTTYNYFLSTFGRDSYDNQGGIMRAIVHEGSASWSSSQDVMICGDGDGTSWGNFCESLDVIAHEIGHGVTDYESKLVYANESGALNEAYSDIFGVGATIYTSGVNSDTWLIGEEVYTPNTPGDALRYMNNPTRDNQSYDYYPERYTGSQDNGGVHLNSGIMNLAFYLMSQGGSHPRGKTSTVVSAIGNARAQQIFYRAQVQGYLTANATFADMRAASIRAAEDLYGSSISASVADAWTAVGVGTSDNGGGDDCATGTLSSSNTEDFYTISGSGSTTVNLSGPSGTDFDLYLQRSTNGGRSWRNIASSTSYTSDESVTATLSSSFSYRIRVARYSGSGEYTVCLQ
ncbi:M4 family metallopeptidase [Acanthopleuribacter pedis]|uniref:Neutral metalloproteinase n=1 Tax=Acanthopleuribacter pedis TaxID=442870 RepID=A0A8J7QJ55_9BACT|nr:M4 family metallopeptidase [Acanthopleuribacter pedis]MBO1321746.1 M4 family metallopeptidase [Acanthopleuribacter pedis]